MAKEDFKNGIKQKNSVTKEDIKEGLRQVVLGNDDTVLVHSSLMQSQQTLFDLCEDLKVQNFLLCYLLRDL